MDGLFTPNLPAGIRDLVGAPAGSSLSDLAHRAMVCLTGIQDDVARSKAARHVLTFLHGRGDVDQREVVARALEVMDRFPHYPRPRAEIARRALEMLASA